MASYACTSLLEVREMPYDLFLELRRDAFIDALNHTESGRDYLDRAWQLEQTEPDRASLRDAFGRKE